MGVEGLHIVGLRLQKTLVKLPQVLRPRLNGALSSVFCTQGDELRASNECFLGPSRESGRGRAQNPQLTLKVHVPKIVYVYIYTLGPMYLYREYFKAKVCTTCVHGPLGSVHFEQSARIQGELP